ncbi:MAG TPA: type 1 periplasmic binding fold superfamily protein [Vicingus sp.]|nr:type 1 periplasmic binding fold superfamily protein [Vicingus sp.]
MKNKIKSIFTILMLSLVVFACKKDDKTPTPSNPNGNTPPPNEEELITTIVLTFTDTMGLTTPFTVTFADPDGDGGNAPTTHEVINLDSNKYYNVSIQFLDQSKTPAEDITQEVVAEADEHLICYNLSGANLSVTRSDSDGTYELGVHSFWSTGLPSSGTVTVVLKHQPGIKDGTCAPGDTDVEVVFDFHIH